jgi:hypothetical protein
VAGKYLQNLVGHFCYYCGSIDFHYQAWSRAMSRRTFLVITAVLFVISQTIFAQPKRIAYNNQQLFLNGVNLAWVNFGSDIGPGSTDFDQFADILLQVHNNGGNAVRWWLHTNGIGTPQFSSDSGFVIGPGAVCIADIKKVLDLAWERGVGVNLCLWSFNMLDMSNGTTVVNRNTLLLNDMNYTRRYINNCLIPMVDSLKHHPAIIAWEIFNEPEGMSNEFGWTSQKVPMSSIQRFVNLCAGAIHREDSTAQVTNGCWSFYSLTDNPLAKTSTKLSKLNAIEKTQIATFFQQKYRSTLSPDEIISYLDKVANGPTLNYYRDDRLIDAGGDLQGTLDFYSVHYYSTISQANPTGISPFHHKPVSFGLSKPVVVAEFAMESSKGSPPDIDQSALYDTLYQLGYAGALAWSWTDVQFSSRTHMLAGMQSMWKNHRSDVAVNVVTYSWPSITITNPPSNASYPDSTGLTFYITVSDTMPISSVAFYEDTMKIGEVLAPYYTSYDTSFYSWRWNAISPGSYRITAVATNSVGHQKVSNTVLLSIGKSPMMKLEAEAAARQGSNMTVKSDASASNSACVDAATNDTIAKITWYFTNVAPAGTYEIAFGYKLNYASPKTQYINVNGVRIGTLEFTGASTATWYERTMNVPLLQGSNIIQMQMFWGWMYVDYLAVPRAVLTAVAEQAIVPTTFVLEQNYPNPFNPITTIKYSLPHSEYVRLIVYDILGRQVAVLVDKNQDAGVYETAFDAHLLTSGVYFYRLNIGTFTTAKKMLLLK